MLRVSLIYCPSPCYSYVCCVRDHCHPPKMRCRCAISSGRLPSVHQVFVCEGKAPPETVTSLAWSWVSSVVRVLLPPKQCRHRGDAQRPIASSDGSSLLAQQHEVRKWRPFKSSYHASRRHTFSVHCHSVGYSGFDVPYFACQAK